MNIYVLIEGEKATKKLYTTWIRYVNSNLYPVEDLRDLKHNNFFIQAGYGQPGYWNMVERAVEDVNNLQVIDRLVISVDSEERDFCEQLSEAKKYVNKVKCRVDVKYIIQHFCLETWLLGNIYVFRKKPQDKELQEYFNLFNIRVNDPELLSGNVKHAWNRSQFALRYLKAGISDTYNNRRGYSKSNPGVAMDESYFHQVKVRCLEKQHIASFKCFLDAFV